MCSRVCQSLKSASPAGSASAQKARMAGPRKPMAPTLTACPAGASDSLFGLLFFPLVAVNASLFGPWIGRGGAVVAGLLYAAAAVLTPPWVGWNAVLILIGLVGLPALAVGMVANRERRARVE